MVTVFNNERCNYCWSFLQKYYTSKHQIATIQLQSLALTRLCDGVLIKFHTHWRSPRGCHAITIASLVPNTCCYGFRNARGGFRRWPGGLPFRKISWFAPIIATSRLWGHLTGLQQGGKQLIEWPSTPTNYVEVIGYNQR